jgi:hypothetical protein
MGLRHTMTLLETKFRHRLNKGSRTRDRAIRRVGEFVLE